MTIVPDVPVGPGLQIPDPPADIARELKAERARRSLRRRLAATPRADQPTPPADPEDHIDQMASRNQHM